MKSGINPASDQHFPEYSLKPVEIAGNGNSHRSESDPRRKNSILADVSRTFSKMSKDVGRALGEDPPEKPDPTNDEIQHSVRHFCEQTTFHGVNMIYSTGIYWVRGLWISVCLMSVVFLMISFSQVYAKYSRREKIVNVELQFEAAPFPAITVCNLNPFKNHLARSVPEISETLDAFHQAVMFSNDAQFDSERNERGKRSSEDGVKQSFKYLQYEPVYADCTCLDNKEECIVQLSVPKDLKSACICNYDRQDGTAWPCYRAEAWTESICPECNDIGYCNVPNTTGIDDSPCYCQSKKGYCIFKPEKRLRRMWEFRGKKIPEKGSPLRKEYMEQLLQLGYGNMTDQVAITTQAREKMILKMSALIPERRAALGYGKSELIKMCSFNGHQCNIEKEFKLHIDASFGNCYTFNANPKQTILSSRAGPSYGLRLMLFVNSSDYLPTTEATGVRIAIHGQQECPFPDTFGYSAPTGAISSFGIGLREVNRLTKYGNCYENEFPGPNSIYREYKYEPEGCHRSCYQQQIIRSCKCADSRFPKGRSNVPYCDSGDKDILKCMMQQSAKLSKKNHICKCMHPCHQNQYTTTYSAAKWPSGSLKAQCPESVTTNCNQYLSEHAAMIEIYYEQMNYEILREYESYSIFNLISDMGGQAGLFLGASIMSCVEFIFFILRIIGAICKPNRKQKEKLLKSDDDLEKSAQT